MGDSTITRTILCIAGWSSNYFTICESSASSLLISAASMLTYTKSLITTACVFSSRLLSRGLANIVRRNTVEEFSEGVLVEKMLFIGAWELMHLVIPLF